MHTTYDLDMLKAMGFSEAKPRLKSAYRGEAWSDEEVEAMLQCLANISNSSEGIHTRDPFTTFHTTPCCAKKPRAGQIVVEIRRKAIQLQVVGQS